MGFLFQANHVYPYKTLFLLARLPMIAITISNSMSVKPDVFLCVGCFCMTIHNYWFQIMVIALEVLENTSSEVLIIMKVSSHIVGYHMAFN